VINKQNKQNRTGKQFFAHQLTARHNTQF